MPIREKGYHAWDGELIPGHKSWKTIGLQGIKEVFRKRFSKIVFFACSINFLIFLLIVYAIAKPELKMFTEAVDALKTDASMFNMYLNIPPFIGVMFFLIMFAGAGQISRDIKFKSFTLYFSRPVSRIDYIKGKMMAVLFYYLMFTMVPALFLIFEKMVLSGSFAIDFRALTGAIIFPLVVGTFFSSFILLISSITPNTKMVYIMIFASMTIPDILGGIFRGTFGSDYFLYLSMWTNIKQFGAGIFGVSPPFDIPAWISGAILITISCAAIWALHIRLSRVEV